MKYTKEKLQEVANISVSCTDMAKYLGLRPVGSTLTYLRKRCEDLNINCNHFTRSGHRKGGYFPRKTSDDILVMQESNTGRAEVKYLKRSLLELGTEEKCECGQGTTWNGKPLTLQIDHINGRYWDNRRENLRFICPNCHTQTDTWGNKKRT